MHQAKSNSLQSLEDKKIDSVFSHRWIQGIYEEDIPGAVHLFASLGLKTVHTCLCIWWMHERYRIPVVGPARGEGIMLARYTERYVLNSVCCPPCQSQQRLFARIPGRLKAAWCSFPWKVKSWLVVCRPVLFEIGIFCVIHAASVIQRLLAKKEKKLVIPGFSQQEIWPQRPKYFSAIIAVHHGEGVTSLSGVTHGGDISPGGCVTCDLTGDGGRDFFTCEIVNHGLTVQLNMIFSTLD